MMRFSSNVIKTVKQTCTFIVGAGLLIALVACATATATPEQIKNADYGQIPENYKELIQNYMSTRLIDPDSAHYRFLKAAKGYAFLNGTVRPPTFGYLVAVGIDAKYGICGYREEIVYAFLFKGTLFWELETYTSDQWVE